MIEFNIRLVATTLLLPVQVMLALAVALTGCTAQLSTPSPPPPDALATVFAPFGIAVDSTTIYVTELSLAAVQAIPVAGGLATPLPVEGAGRAILVDGGRLYWSNEQAIVRCDKSNCADTTVTMAPLGGRVTDMAADATSVYWTEAEDVGAGRVMKMDKDGVAPPSGAAGSDAAADEHPDGGAPVTLPVQLAVSNWPSNVAVDATNVYWIEQGQPAGVWKVPLAGGPAVRIARSDEYEPEGLALDELNVYFADGGGTVFKAPKSGGPATVMVAHLGLSPAGLAADATNLYVAASTEILSRPLAGGKVRTLAGGLAGAGSIAQDATSVYVTDDLGNAIVKVSKDPDARAD